MTTLFVLTRESDERELASFIVLDNATRSAARAASLGHGPCQLTETYHGRACGIGFRYVDGALAETYYDGDWVPAAGGDDFAK